MSELFNQLIESVADTLTEAPEGPPMGDVPPAPAPAPPAGGAAAPDMGMGGGGMDMGMGEPAPAPEEEMDNASKRETDPTAYTEETLAKLVDPQEGITPDLFGDWLDTFDVGLAKVRDKEGLKRFYNDFYEKIQLVIEVKHELKDMFESLHGTLKDVIGAKATSTPDNAGGGEGTQTTANGPGV
jgi:hypothetical protein